MTTINANFAGLTDMTDADMVAVNGGDSFWETLGYIVGATAKCIYVFSKTAAEYQASLPPNLKK